MSYRVCTYHIRVEGSFFAQKVITEVLKAIARGLMLLRGVNHVEVL